MANEPAASSNNRPPPAHRWLGRGLYALLDQGLYAAGNFAVQILLARLLPEADYGAFATGYALLILVGTLHTAFLTEPMLVFGSRRYHRRLPAYLHQLLRQHLKFTLGFAAAFAIAATTAWLANQQTLAEALFAFAIAQAFILLPWMLRSAAYINHNPRVAALGSALYCTALLLSLALLHHQDQLTLTTAILTLGIASALTSACLLPALNIPFTSPTHPRRPDFSRDAPPARIRHRTRHRRYGFQAAPTNLVRFFPHHFPFLVLPLLLSYQDNAGYKAMSNLTVPFILFTASLSTLALPVLVRRLHQPDFHRLLTKLTLIAALPPLLLWPLIAGLAHWHLPLIYGGRYLDDAALLWVLAATPAVAAVHTLLHAAFQAAEQPQRILPPALAACAILLLAAWPMTHYLGLLGMTLTVLAAHLTQATTALLILRQAIQPIQTHRSHPATPNS